MNNKIIMGVVGVVIVAAAGFFVFKGKSTTTPYTAPSNTSSTSQSSSTQSSLKSLIASGQNQKCTFTNPDTGANTQGTVYVTSGHFRGDFSSVVSGKIQMSHMISDGHKNSIWLDGSANGYTTTFDPTGSVSSNDTSTVDTNKSMNFNCSPWTVDSSVFTLPAEIKFTDMSSITAPSGSSSTNVQTNDSIQTACMKLSEPARTQCLNSYQ